jgi:hypothetical protein
VNRDPDERGQSDGAVPDEFDAIVSAWRREGEVPEWPADAEQASGLFEPTPPIPETPAAETPAPRQEPEPPVPVRPTADPVPLDDDHFVPPEPPPLPRLGPPAFVGLGLIGLGLVLLLAPGFIVPEPYGLPLGLVGLASGLGWLVLRLWPDPPSHGGDGDDDGAVV